MKLISSGIDSAVAIEALVSTAAVGALSWAAFSQPTMRSETTPDAARMDSVDALLSMVLGGCYEEKLNDGLPVALITPQDTSIFPILPRVYRVFLSLWE